jgi:hypothetical protein
MSLILGFMRNLIHTRELQHEAVILESRFGIRREYINVFVLFFYYSTCKSVAFFPFPVLGCCMSRGQVRPRQGAHNCTRIHHLRQTSAISPLLAPLSGVNNLACSHNRLASACKTTPPLWSLKR